jgi:hypothetical protein
MSRMFPDLDVDLSIESIRSSEKVPLKAQNTYQACGSINHPSTIVIRNAAWSQRRRLSRIRIAAGASHVMKCEHILATTPAITVASFRVDYIKGMATQSEVLAKIFSIFDGYESDWSRHSSSPEDWLTRNEDEIVRYVLGLDEFNTHALCADLSDAFGIEFDDFFNFFFDSSSPSIGNLVRLILSKVDVT